MKNPKYTKFEKYGCECDESEYTMLYIEYKDLKFKEIVLEKNVFIDRVNIVKNKNGTIAFKGTKLKKEFFFSAFKKMYIDFMIDTNMHVKNKSFYIVDKQDYENNDALMDLIQQDTYNIFIFDYKTEKPYSYIQFSEYNDRDVVYIGALFTDKSMQGKGYANALLNYVNNFAYENKIDILVMVQNLNKHTFNYYKKFGFKELKK